MATTNVNVLWNDTLLRCGILLTYYLYFEDRGNTFLRNVGAFISDCTALLSGRLLYVSKHSFWVSIFLVQKDTNGNF